MTHSCQHLLHHQNSDRLRHCCLSQSHHLSRTFLRPSALSQLLPLLSTSYNRPKSPLWLSQALDQQRFLSFLPLFTHFSSILRHSAIFYVWRNWRLASTMPLSSRRPPTPPFQGFERLAYISPLKLKDVKFVTWSPVWAFPHSSY